MRAATRMVTGVFSGTTIGRVNCTSSNTGGSAHPVSAIADWATALLFSNEAASPDPRFDYLGSGWAPLHARLRHLDWQGLGGQGATVSLRVDGISVLVTGASSGGPAALTVYSSAAVKPYVVVARFSGDLPR